jgi:hypothetical protein
MRVRSLRQYLKLAACRVEHRDGQLNLERAALQLGVSASVVRRLIEQRLLPATQIVSGAPWQIDAKDVASSEIIQAAMALKHRVNQLRHKSVDNRTLPLPGLSEESSEDGVQLRVLQTEQR